MNGKAIYGLMCTVLIAGLLFLPPRAAADNSASLIGTETTNFSLSSAQNRLVSYGNDYYGRHNLIITFFPAAFTPV